MTKREHSLVVLAVLALACCVPLAFGLVLVFLEKLLGG